jgi:serine protease Do/serine protease DegQ
MMNQLNVFLGTFVFAMIMFPLLCVREAHATGFTPQYDDSKLDRTQTSPVVSYSEILKKATPAVVAVTTKQVVRRGVKDPLEDFLRRYYGLPRGNQPRFEEESVPAGIGSGVIVTPQGHTITNAHVITDPRTGALVEEVTVKLSNKKEYEAKIIGFDRSTDIAVLKIDAPEPLPHATLANSDFLEVGDVVFAVGNPLGIGKTVTMGIISATRRSELGVLEEGAYENFIQTDASINRGNSGGALLDAKGRLIGINTAIISQTGASIGIGLAIPVNMVKNVLNDLVKGGGLKRGFLGVILDDDPDPSIQGAIVDRVEVDSPADQAGLKPRDIIVNAGGKPVTSVNQLRVAISQTQPGTRMLVKVLRDGRKMDFYVTLDLRDDPVSSPIPGVSLEPLSSSRREQFKVPSSVRGIVVTKSTGEAKTFKEGVVLVEINGDPINSVSDAERLLKRGINRFYIWYRNKFQYLAYRIP